MLRIVERVEKMKKFKRKIYKKLLDWKAKSNGDTARDLPERRIMPQHERRFMPPVRIGYDAGFRMECHCKNSREHIPRIGNAEFPVDKIQGFRQTAPRPQFFLYGCLYHGHKQSCGNAFVRNVTDHDADLSVIQAENIVEITPDFLRGDHTSIYLKSIS